MAFHEAIGVMGILFLVVVTPIWLFLHYGSRWRQAKLLTTESEKTLAEMADIADKMQSRIENLERLLDTTAPDWRKKP
ncbi:MAG: pspB [Rhodospirillales bacterium]|nr:pspB [Rhodospirillales bacterium]